MTKNNSKDSISLYYKNSGSDKEYHAQVKQQENGYAVVFQYGRRGTTLQTGQKNSNPVDYETAQKILNDLRKSKESKGYSPGEAGTPYVATSKEDRETGLHPQLLNSIDEAGLAELVEDDDYCMQAKFDGRRIMIKIENGNVEGSNRLGLTVGVPMPVVNYLGKGNMPDGILDGELIGDEYFAFDLLEYKGKDLRGESYLRRYSTLRDFYGISNRMPMKTVESAFNRTSKQLLFERLQTDRAEGVVFKNLSAPYVAGRPASGGNQLKYKFVESASFVVMAVNNKRSVLLQARTDEKATGGGFVWKSVGNVTIPPNYDIPEVGDVVEVEYLYAYKGGSVYQPVYKGKRDDIPEDNCSIKQLKYKPESED